MPKVSVIIPIYNVEKFIAKCATTLFEQTLEDVEFIFVDDASPDNSVGIINEVLKKYPNRKEQTRIIKHESNKGLPAARNTGLAVATGDYIFHCDGDDYVETDMLEAMYGKATEENADIVWSDWFLTFEQNERYMKQPDYSTPMGALKAMMSGGMKYNVWNKLAKRELYTAYGISFPAGYSMGEDMTMLNLFAVAKKVAFIPRAFYHYVKFNASAMSYGFSQDKLEALTHNINMVDQFLKNHCKENLSQEVNFMKLEAKWPLLIAGQSSLYKDWKKIFPEANSAIGKNPYLSKRRKLVESATKNSINIIPWLHYWIVCRFYYGIVYK